MYHNMEENDLNREHSEGLVLQSYVFLYVNLKRNIIHIVYTT